MLHETGLVKRSPDHDSQFGGVSMSAILECSFPTGARKALQPVGGRTTDLDPGLGSSLLPPMTCLYKGNHLLFGRASLLRFHRSLLARTLFTKRLFPLPRGNMGLPLSGDDHLAKVRLAEVRLVETGPTDAASTEVCPTKICASQLGSIELRSDQISLSEARLSEVGSQQEDLSEIGLSQVGLSEIGLVQSRFAQIGPAQVGSHEIGVPQIGTTQIGFAEISLTQIGVDLRMLSSPRIPRSDSLLENSEVLLICHGVSLLFGCASHYIALEETLQGHSARLVRKGNVAISY